MGELFGILQPCGTFKSHELPSISPSHSQNQKAIDRTVGSSLPADGVQFQALLMSTYYFVSTAFVECQAAQSKIDKALGSWRLITNGLPEIKPIPPTPKILFIILGKD